MLKFNPYLNFDGNAEEAFNFYKSVIGGEFSIVQKFKDMPGAEKMSAEDANKIMHISLPLSDGYTLMASDTLEAWGQKLKVGNNVYINLSPDSEEEADRLFNGLSAGGKVEMAMEKTFWGAYFGSFADKYGVQWMINYEYEKK
ncbi:MAG: VOC family protein [Chitinophagaceae bacterium]|nr:VOC family protein [Chitinophagaceae bacterium]